MIGSQERGSSRILGFGHETDPGPINYMTQATWNRLNNELPIAREKVEAINLSKGDAAGSGSDWHDNPAYEEAIRESVIVEQRYNQLQDKLRKVVIIEPRQETDFIGLGNEVVVRFEDEEADETFVLLGADDSATGKNFKPQWISIDTPLGQALLGQTRGTTIEVNAPAGKIRVKIKKINAGSF